MPCGDLNQIPHHRHQYRHHQHQQLQHQQQQQHHSIGQLQSKEILDLNNLNQMMAAVPAGGCGVVGAGRGVAQIHGSLSAPLHHLTVDVNLNHVMRPTSQSMKSPTSPNPLDNANLRRQSTGLSAFNDYVDLVKRHLMYAVREEVEILKQQIGEMMERIGQLEYENTLLKSEAKPETLSKLLLPRVSQAAAPQQIQMSSGGGGGGSVAAAVGGTAGVVVPSQQQQQQQQQQQSAVLAPQAQKPPTPSGQQTPGAMIPPQQVQTVASGTSTPTQQQQQHLVHQTSTQQPG